jgi:hypothetical protein
MVAYFGLAATFTTEVDDCNDVILSCVGVMACVVCTGVGGVAGACGLDWSWEAWTEARWRMIGVRSVSCISMVILGDD